MESTHDNNTTSWDGDKRRELDWKPAQVYRTPHSEGTNRDETIAKRLKAFNWIELVHKTMLCFAHISTSANQRRRSYVFISINPLKMSVCMRARLNVTHSMQCSEWEKKRDSMIHARNSTEMDTLILWHGNSVKKSLHQLHITHWTIVEIWITNERNRNIKFKWNACDWSKQTKTYWERNKGFTVVFPVANSTSQS